MAAVTAGWSIRLRELFGARFQDVTEHQLQAMVEGRVREDSDLDFKQTGYGSSDSQKRELAADIAAMANDRGGAIVVGIRDEDDVAAELTPVERSEGEEARLRQIAAGNIVPHVSFEVYQVDSEVVPGNAYYLLVVPPSPLRPHAVRKDIDLRFPRRNGSTTRWLSEAEVADMYRDRFTAFRDETARVATIVDQGLRAMERFAADAYLAVALVPAARGSMPIDLAAVTRLEGWVVEPTGTYGWRGFFGDRPNARAGIRRVRLGSLLTGRPPTSTYAELYADGSGFSCERLTWGRESGPGAARATQIRENNLFWEVARSLRLLGRHSVENAGAWGDAVVVASLHGREMHLTYGMHGGIVQEPYNHLPVQAPLDSRHTLPVESLAGADQELLMSARIVATDLFNAFGAAEVKAVDSAGRLRVRYLERDNRLADFAAAHGVETSDEVI